MADDLESWTLTLPCTRAEAEMLDHEDARLWDLSEIPTFAAREPDPAKPEAWEIAAYFSQKPKAADIKLIQSLFPSAAKAKPLLEKVAQQDWVTLSQQGLEPVRAGRFFIHTSNYTGQVPPGAISFQIEASRAFGTGGHETTSRCLAMLDKLAQQGAHFRNIADIGTGTGLLAFAARHLWPIADVTASDIDPISIEVSDENA
ncbi:MAG: 50S ribosomal protein L11 methyltransferase, partial [Sphingomonadaceae bacterium]|nr:50S ribosomal protein L11 methyltransferase [Sphingomonadaceae bacterium]